MVNVPARQTRLAAIQFAVAIEVVNFLPSMVPMPLLASSASISWINVPLASPSVGLESFSKSSTGAPIDVPVSMAGEPAFN